MDGLGACRFLLVDSNDYMREIIEAVVRGFGVRKIVKVRSAEDALEQMQRFTFDVITTDYVLPSLDGVEFTRLTRRWEDNPNRYVPIIMITAYASRPRIEAARDAGVTEICAKPLAPRDLFRKLVAINDHSRCFVSAPAYIGPDRRRRADPAYAGPERRADAIRPVAAQMQVGAGI